MPKITNFKRKIAIMSCAALALVLAAPAQATLYQISWTGAPVYGNGFLDVNATFNGVNWVVNSITGGSIPSLIHGSDPAASLTLASVGATFNTGQGGSSNFGQGYGQIVDNVIIPSANANTAHFSTFVADATNPGNGGLGFTDSNGDQFVFDFNSLAGDRIQYYNSLTNTFLATDVSGTITVIDPAPAPTSGVGFLGLGFLTLIFAAAKRRELSGLVG